jgi:mRNA interferase ChpB
MRLAKRGDIWRINLDPTQGSEQQGHRPVLVVSDKVFNQAGLVWVCPITQGGQYARFAGFSVPLINCGTQTQGIVACHQIRTLDYQARHAHFIETVPAYVVDEVLARLQTVLE